MSLRRKIANRTQRRAYRVRKKLKSAELPRASVFRSLKHIYAQIIDDKNQKTLASCSSLELKDLNKKDKKAIAHQVGLELAKRAIESGINNIVFDRGTCLFHGRVKSLAEGLREGGMQI